MAPQKTVPITVRALLALSPLIFLGLLMLTRFYGATTYVFCQPPCQSIGANLNRVLLADGPPCDLKTMEKSWWTTKANKTVADAEVAGSIYSGRLTWLFLTAAYLITSLVGFAVGGRIIYQPLAKSFGKRLVLALALAAAVMATLYLWPVLHMPLLLQLMQTTLLCDIPSVKNTINATNSFGFAAAFLLSLATVTVLWEIEKKDQRPSLAELELAMRRLRLMLYAGTVMLVVGMLFERALFQWSLAFLSRDEQAQKIAQGFFATIVAVDGGFYTILLAAVFIPAALIVKGRVEDKLLPAGAEDRQKILKEHGLDFSFSEALPKLLAIMAPLLAGPIGELFGRLAK